MPPKDDVVTNATLDRAIKQFERTTDMVDTLSRNSATLAAEVHNACEDIKKLERIIQGNGAAGLTTRVELNASRISKIDDLLAKTSNLDLANIRGRWGFYTAVGLAITTGVISMVVQFTQ